ncbi:MAG: hypothetical protein L6R36_003140 [Xanthoria steineri]|nr:MAG: hypothetical protein L6R36_003140 [Xanthoria steineri]
MAPSQQARRLTWNQNQTPESSESGYGQEILPTIDMDALTQLPPHEQEAFKEMRLKDRRRILARWRKEGRPSPRRGNSPTNDSTAQLMRTSSAPQLPELQMDVPISTFTDADDSTDVDGTANVRMPAIQARQEIIEQGGTDDALQTPHRPLGFTPSLLSLRSKRSQTELYLDETPEKRCLRKLHRDQLALENIANEQDREWCRFRGVGAVPPGLGLSAHSPSPADRVIARTITRNHAVVQETGHQPDAYDTIGIAQVVEGEERALRAANGSPDLRGPLFVRTRRASVSPAKPPMLVSKKTARQQQLERSPQASEDGLGPIGSQTGGESVKHGIPNRLHEQISSIHISPGKLVGRKIEASKNWIRNVFKGKTERKKKARAPGRPARRIHLQDEAQVGVAKRVSLMSLKAPQPSRPSFFVERGPPTRRAPSPPHFEQPRPSLQSASVHAHAPPPPPSCQAIDQPSRPQRSPPRLQNPPQVHKNGHSGTSERGRSSSRRTTRAMMEGYD